MAITLWTCHCNNDCLVKFGPVFLSDSDTAPSHHMCESGIGVDALTTSRNHHFNKFRWSTPSDWIFLIHCYFSSHKEITILRKSARSQIQTWQVYHTTFKPFRISWAVYGTDTRHVEKWKSSPRPVTSRVVDQVRKVVRDLRISNLDIPINRDHLFACLNQSVCV